MKIMKKCKDIEIKQELENSSAESQISGGRNARTQQAEGTTTYDHI